jgi:O-antigen/teichoic acid export membrane protein
MVPIYALYSVITGYYNGMRDYRIQASLLLLYDISKPMMIFLLVFLGFSVWGAVLGFALGPVVPMIAGIYLMGLRSVWSDAYPYKKILRFAIPIIVFSTAVNLIMSLDLFFVKRILIDNELAGFYSAASMIARVPYSLVGALTAALFPAISASMNDRQKTREYINESIRYTLLILVPLTLVVAASSSGLVSLIYSSVYKPAGVPLGILILGESFFALFAVLTTVISGSGKPGISMLLSLLILLVDFISNQILVPLWGMEGAALSTGISSVIGLSIAAFYVYRQHGVLTPASSTARILLASSLLFVAVSYMKPEGLWLIFVYILAGAVYLLLLFLLKEIKPRDLERFNRLIKRFYRDSGAA